MSSVILSSAIQVVVRGKLWYVWATNTERFIFRRCGRYVKCIVVSPNVDGVLYNWYNRVRVKRLDNYVHWRSGVLKCVYPDCVKYGKCGICSEHMDRVEYACDFLPKMKRTNPCEDPYILLPSPDVLLLRNDMRNDTRTIIYKVQDDYVRFEIILWDRVDEYKMYVDICEVSRSRVILLEGSQYEYAIDLEDWLQDRTYANMLQYGIYVLTYFQCIPLDILRIINDYVCRYMPIFFPQLNLILANIILSSCFIKCQQLLP